MREVISIHIGQAGEFPLPSGWGSASAPRRRESGIVCPGSWTSWGQLDLLELHLNVLLLSIGTALSLRRHSSCLISPSNLLFMALRGPALG